MSATRRAWIIIEAICALLGALILVLPLFTNAPGYTALFGILPMSTGLLGLGLWTIGGKGL